MTLYIDTTDNEKMIISLKEQGKVVAREEIMAHRAQAEKLLPGIEKMLKKNKLKLADLKEIRVANIGGTFTALRIGVVTANALAYALGIPVKGEGETGNVKSKNKLHIVKPVYNREPNITARKK